MDYSVYVGKELSQDVIDNIYDHILEDGAERIINVIGRDKFHEDTFLDNMLHALYRYEKAHFDLALTYDEWRANNGGCYKK
ncbi:MAG: hypothetical protein LKF69_01450 [Bacilli bacterium]|jgi:hypothetical protein|nr:hypothetical protein [Bacilli bacterium]MCH4235453.1 hypothetical protein [Bacilli bacterium]